MNKEKLKEFIAEFIDKNYVNENFNMTLSRDYKDDKDENGNIYHTEISNASITISFKK